MKSLMRLCCLVLALCLPAVAFATPAPEVFVKGKQEEVHKLLKQTGGNNDPRIGAVLDELLDYDAFARDSLGDEWDKRSDAERKKFSGLLKQLVQKSYRNGLKKTINYDIDYKGGTKAEKGYLVRTVARSKKNAREEPISIDYLVHDVDGHWKIRDIVAEGSSTVSNYRNSFRRIIKKQGFEELIKKMETKLAKG